MRAWRWGGAWNRRRRSIDGGAPGPVRPTARNVTFSNKSTPSVIRRKGRRGRRPLRWLRVGMFQRSREVQFITPVTLYAARPVSLLPVRGGVLDAPRSCDRRAALDASFRRDRQHPRLIRCACLASTAQRMQSRGHSPRTISSGRTGVIHLSHAGRAWKPSPTVCGEDIRVSPTSPATPQSRRFAPRQLPFQGSREGGVRRTAVVHLTHAARNPSVTPLRGATAPLSGEPRGGRSFSPLRIQFRARGLRAFACRGGRAVVQYAQGA